MLLALKRKIEARLGLAVVTDAQRQTLEFWQSRGAFTNLHPWVKGIPSRSRPGISAAPPSAGPELTARIVTAAARSREIIGGRTNNVWEDIANTNHRDLHRAMLEGDTAALKRLLEGMYTENNILYGIDQCLDMYGNLQNLASMQTAAFAAHCFDVLVAVAEAIGCLPMECPEAGRWATNLYETDVDALVDRIADAVGCDITPPLPARGKIGLQTKRGIFSDKDANAIYVAWRIRDMVGGDRKAPICEIGAGVGTTAYYCHRFGLKNYTIIDLPQINAIQAYFLGTALSPKAITLAGEAGADSFAEDTIRILPFTEFTRVPERAFALVLNQDSMPEMGVEIASGYLRGIRTRSRRYFLSINQESERAMSESAERGRQPVVGNLCREVGGLTRVARFPYWARAGYVEEHFEVER